LLRRSLDRRSLPEELRLPFASQAADVTVSDQMVRVTRQTEFGDEEIEVPLPALVSVGDSINEPRYTSLKGVMGAKKKPLENVTLADLGIDTADAGQGGARTVALGIGSPPSRAGGPSHGFALFATGRRPHFDIVLADLDDRTLERFAARVWDNDKVTKTEPWDCGSISIASMPTDLHTRASLTRPQGQRSNQAGTSSSVTTTSIPPSPRLSRSHRTGWCCSGSYPAPLASTRPSSSQGPAVRDARGTTGPHEGRRHRR
jgi:hypothetical protein